MIYLGILPNVLYLLADVSEHPVCYIPEDHPKKTE